MLQQHTTGSLAVAPTQPRPLCRGASRCTAVALHPCAGNLCQSYSARYSLVLGEESHCHSLCAEHDRWVWIFSVRLFQIAINGSQFCWTYFLCGYLASEFGHSCLYFSCNEI